MKKTLKKVLCLFASAVFVLSLNTFAASDALLVNEIICKNGAVTVNGTAPENEYVTLRLVKETATDERDYDNIFAVEEVLAGENGSFTVSFVLPDEKNGLSTEGDYTFNLRSNSGESVTAPFSYASKEMRENTMQLIQSAGSKDNFLALFTEENKASLENIGVSVSLTNSSSDIIDEAAELIVNNCNLEEITPEELYTVTSEYTALAKVNISSDEAVADVLSELNPVLGDKNFTDYSSDEQEFITKVILKNREYRSSSEFSNILSEADILNKLTAAKYTALTEIISENAEILGIFDDADYKAYIGGSDDEQEEINKILVEVLRDKTVYSGADLLKEIGDALDDIDDNGSSSSSGGKTSSGGGKGAGSSYTMSPIVTPGNNIASNDMFTDVPKSHWAYGYVNSLAGKKIISGYEDNTFKPSNNVSREEFVKLIVTASGTYNQNAVCAFADVQNDTWYAPYVASAVENSVVNGIDENNFGTGLPVTREDAAVIVARILKLSSSYDMSAVSDAASISEYALEGVKALYEAGILSGDADGQFRPKDYITRAEAAKIIYFAFGGDK